MRNRLLFLSAMLAFVWGFVSAQAPLKTYSVYDVNHDDSTSVSDVTLVVNRTLQDSIEDPQVVIADSLNAFLKEIVTRFQKLDSLALRIERIEKRLGLDKPDAPFEPDVNGYEYVDLGMIDAKGRPIYWATCNIGAEKPEDYGLYFAWGDVKGYGKNTSDGQRFSWTTYKWCEGTSNTLTKYCDSENYGIVDNKTVLEAEDDAAHEALGGDWRMPTASELKWLFNSRNCASLWDDTKKGYVFTSKLTGESIFIPAAGCRSGTGLYDPDKSGYLWSSTLGSSSTGSASCLFFNSGSVKVENFFRYYGWPIRGVCALSE